MDQNIERLLGELSRTLANRENEANGATHKKTFVNFLQTVYSKSVGSNSKSKDFLFSQRQTRAHTRKRV